MPIALLIFLGVFIAVSFCLLFAVCLCKAASKPIPSSVVDPSRETTSLAPPGPANADSPDEDRGADFSLDSAGLKGSVDAGSSVGLVPPGHQHAGTVFMISPEPVLAELVHSSSLRGSTPDFRLTLRGGNLAAGGLLYDKATQSGRTLPMR